MRKLRKPLSWLLAVCMLFSLLPGTALAADPDPAPVADTTTYTDWEDLFGVGGSAYLTTKDIGRIWTDKSVSTQDITLPGTNIDGLENNTVKKEAGADFLVALSGLNELVYRLTTLVVSNQTNLNDTTISAQIEDAPHMTLLIVIFLAPFVEEVLFRGLVFGNLRRKSAAVGYLVSCLLFALLHVWQFAVVNRDITYFLLMLQYLVPGLVLAWVYDRTGTLWTSIGLHAAANALSAWTLVA